MLQNIDYIGLYKFFEAIFMNTFEREGSWSVSEAKSRLSEVLRCARESGPQMIGKRSPCVLVSREEWEARVEPKESLSLWLLRHGPGTALEVPERGKSAGRRSPFDGG